MTELNNNPNNNPENNNDSYISRTDLENKIDNLMDTLIGNMEMHMMLNSEDNPEERSNMDYELIMADHENLIRFETCFNMYKEKYGQLSPGYQKKEDIYKKSLEISRNSYRKMGKTFTLINRAIRDSKESLDRRGDEDIGTSLED